MSEGLRTHPDDFFMAVAFHDVKRYDWYYNRKGRVVGEFSIKKAIKSLNRKIKEAQDAQRKR